jgi:hypothetical protein
MTPQNLLKEPAGGMVVDVEVGERLVVTVPPSSTEAAGRKLTITMLYKSGRRARLRVSTDEEVAIDRAGAVATS